MIGRNMIKNAERIGVYGRSGSGKSTYVKELLKNNNRVIVFDPLDEYCELKGFIKAKTITDVKQMMRNRWAIGFKIAYLPTSGYEAECMHNLCKLLLQAQSLYKTGKDKRIITLVIEEMNLSFPDTKLPQKFNGFPEVCSRGRHYGIAVIGVSQRMAEVNTRFRGNCVRTILFPLQDHTDITTAVKIISPTNKSKLQNLKNHHYMVYENGQVSFGKNSLK